ncbi:sulfotransferase family cytosolic 2B member 1 isoform X2 [Microcaecilia unicolor]|uniref:Sulfotransferase n=1 Tax=Microcaecilia unicolor TaxID=1415580 RepID=A0A6P7XM84_9AMPH|nr:sulfotransferase family cytosolic 2B member 1-like isoform X2 [Microcaecilia unicolor]
MQTDAGEDGRSKPMEFFNYKGVKFAKHMIFSEENLHFVENEFQVLDDDIYNVTYPKSGTTWMIEILSLICSNGDVAKAKIKTVPNYTRCPWYESTIGMKQIETLTPPRILTSHLPCHIFAKSFFTSNAKIIYTIRNPKDIIVSWYHYGKISLLLQCPEDFEEHLDCFLKGDFLYGSWFDHVWGWIQMKSSKNFFFITYEELQQDLRGSVMRICDFLGKKLDEAAIDSVLENTSFNIMKDNKMANYSYAGKSAVDLSKGSFMRKGISGDWKNQFTVAQSERFDRIYREKMKNFPVKFNWDEDGTEENPGSVTHTS